MKPIHAGHIPVGVKFNPDPLGDYPAAGNYSGVSYCDAIRLASENGGKALLLTADSIQTCRWSPEVLAFRPPDPQYDLKVGYRLEAPAPAILQAPLDRFSEERPPDVVVIRAERKELKKAVKRLGEAAFNFELAGRLDRSALEVFQPGGDRSRKRRVQIVNRALARLNSSREWRRFTEWIFDRRWTTYIYNKILNRYLANMSVCRNSTVVPALTEKANISYFCTGAIVWGQNQPEHMACGLPFELYRKLEWVWPTAQT